MNKAKAIPYVTVGLLMAAILAPAAQARRLPHRAHRPHRPSTSIARNSITAKAAILMDSQTGEVLWQWNPDLPLPPASTTKIVTAILALQSGRLDESVSVTPEAAEAPPSKIRLRPGWQMRLRDLVYAVLLNSANDASVAIAEGLAGSVRTFAERMNATAQAMGARNTHFVNPNGLPAADHYSTARDLATMFSHAMQTPLFATILNTESTTVYPMSGSSRRIALHTHNRLLGNYRIHVVGKTGWTIAAKKCFVGAATTDGRELVVAVLGSRDLWGDLKRLIEFGFRGTDSPQPAAPEWEAAAATAALPVAAGDDDADDGKRVSRRGQHYSLHLGTFHQLRHATRLKSAVDGGGYAARVETLGRGHHHLYRVVVGAYSSHRSAEQAARQLNKRRQFNAVVVASN